MKAVQVWEGDGIPIETDRKAMIRQLYELLAEFNSINWTGTFIESNIERCDYPTPNFYDVFGKYMPLFAVRQSLISEEDSFRQLCSNLLVEFDKLNGLLVRAITSSDHKKFSVESFYQLIQDINRLLRILSQ